MPSVTLNSGTIHYEKSGPSDGRPLVFVHGYMMGASALEAPHRAAVQARLPLPRADLAIGCPRGADE